MLYFAAIQRSEAAMKIQSNKWNNLVRFLVLALYFISLSAFAFYGTIRDRVRHTVTLDVTHPENPGVLKIFAAPNEEIFCRLKGVNSIHGFWKLSGGLEVKFEDQTGSLHSIPARVYGGQDWVNELSTPVTEVPIDLTFSFLVPENYKIGSRVLGKSALLVFYPTPAEGGFVDRIWGRNLLLDMQIIRPEEAEKSAGERAKPLRIMLIVAISSLVCSLVLSYKVRWKQSRQKH